MNFSKFIQKQSAFLKLFSIAALFVGFTANAYQTNGYGGHYFKSLRHDVTIPEKCREVDLSNFATYDLESFTYGPVGANQRGFTYEYPVRRGDARKLWDLARRLVAGDRQQELEKQLRHKKDVLRDFQIIAGNFEEMDFNFASEGEVLEILSILDMGQRLSEDFYVYGSVFYSDKVAGELDLMVGDKRTCEIVAIGEAKLGLGSLGKAHSQLDRFKGFLRTHLHKALNPFDLNAYAR